jgi:hypothetical protein
MGALRESMVGFSVIWSRRESWIRLKSCGLRSKMPHPSQALCCCPRRRSPKWKKRKRRLCQVSNLTCEEES